VGHRTPLTTVLDAATGVGQWRDVVVRVRGLALIGTVGLAVRGRGVRRRGPRAGPLRRRRRGQPARPAGAHPGLADPATDRGGHRGAGDRRHAADLPVRPPAPPAPASWPAPGSSRSSPAWPRRPRWPTSSPGCSWRSPTRSGPRAVGRAGEGAAGDRCGRHRRAGAGAGAGQRQGRADLVRPALPRAGGPGRPAAAGTPDGAAQGRNEGPAGFEEAPAPVAAPAHTSAPAADGAARPPEGLVTGSAEARERSRAFTGPSEEEQAERDPVEETAGAER
jgi:hypothetical protein